MFFLSGFIIFVLCLTLYGIIKMNIKRKLIEKLMNSEILKDDKKFEEIKKMIEGID